MSSLRPRQVCAYVLSSIGGGFPGTQRALERVRRMRKELISERAHCGKTYRVRTIVYLNVCIALRKTECAEEDQQQILRCMLLLRCFPVPLLFMIAVCQPAARPTLSRYNSSAPAFAQWGPGQRIYPSSNTANGVHTTTSKP